MRRLTTILLIELIVLTLCIPGLYAIADAKFPGLFPRPLAYAVQAERTRKLYGIAGSTAASGESGWLSGALQRRFDTWMKNEFFGRRIALQLYKQFAYSVLASPTSDDLVIGRNSQIYETSYILHACDVYPIPTEGEFRTLFAKIAKVQEIFDRSGVGFVFVLSPSKVTTLPRDIPARLCPNGLNATSYRRALRILRSSGVRFVNGEAIALTAQERTGWPMFPRGGTHWTDYAAHETLSAAFDVLNSKPPRSGQLPQIILTGATLGPPVGVEDDILNLLNLFAPDRNYPVVHVRVSRASDAKPRPISIVGDSFSNGLVSLMRRVEYGPIDFLYYYSITHAIFTNHIRYEQKECYDVRQLFLAKDIVILETNVSFINARHVHEFVDDVLKQTESMPLSHPH